MERRYKEFIGWFNSIPELVQMDKQFGATEEFKRSMFERNLQFKYWIYTIKRDAFITGYERNGNFFIWFLGIKLKARKRISFDQLFKRAIAVAKRRKIHIIEVHTNSNCPDEIKSLELLGFVVEKTFESGHVPNTFVAYYYFYKW